jgi:predicted acylesterase/phospholipase RssA
MIALAILVAGICSCANPYLRDDFPHDSGLYAYFNQKAEEGKAPSAGTLVASHDILWQAPANRRVCVRGLLAKGSASDVPSMVRECGGEPDNNLVVAGISGGGLKAEVFALSVLHDLQYGYGLLDDVDAIASASGGSFAALIYGISCDPERCMAGDAWRFRWDDAELKKLKERNYSTAFWFTRFRPGHLLLNAATYHDAGDSMVHMLRSRLLDRKPDATFADLNPARPNLIITATNLTRNRETLLQWGNEDTESGYEARRRNAAQHFSFTSRYFEALGSDLSRYELLRALVASGAYPLGVDPQTLRNYNDTAPAPCDGWPKESACQSFVHLSDGGVHDNLAVSELQWFIECSFRHTLDTRPRIGTNTMLCPTRQRPPTTPRHVLSIVIDASLTASTGRDNQKGEDRLARSGFPLRVLSTARTIDMMSFANATQRKTEFSALASELKSRGIGSGFVDFGLEGLNDPDCFEKDECNTWKNAQTFSSAHGIAIARSVTKESMRDFFEKVANAGFTSLNPDEVLILTEAAHWIVARRVQELCRDGTIKAMFDGEDHAACKGA